MSYNNHEFHEMYNSITFYFIYSRKCILPNMIRLGATQIIFDKMHFLLISEILFVHEIKRDGMTFFMDFTSPGCAEAQGQLADASSVATWCQDGAQLVHNLWLICIKWRVLTTPEINWCNRCWRRAAGQEGGGGQEGLGVPSHNTLLLPAITLLLFLHEKRIDRRIMLEFMKLHICQMQCISQVCNCYTPRLHI